MMKQPNWLELLNTLTISLEKGKSSPLNVLDKILNNLMVRLELWRMWHTPTLPSLLGLLWPIVEAPDRVLTMGQKVLFEI